MENASSFQSTEDNDEEMPLPVKRSASYNSFDFFKSFKPFLENYQRLYVWREKEITELWKDINRNIKVFTDEDEFQVKLKGDLFLGTLFVKQSGNAEETTFANTIEDLEVLDGQQRLLTISLLAKALVMYLCRHDFDRTLIEEIEKFYIYKVRDEDENIKCKPRFGIEKKSSSFLKRILNCKKFSDVENLKDYCKRSPEQKLLQNFRITLAFFKEKEKELEKRYTEEERLDEDDERNRFPYFKMYLSKLTLYFKEKIQFVVNFVSQSSDSATYFFNLNCRGLKINELDKLKNLLCYFSVTYSLSLNEEINSTWNKLHGLLNEVMEKNSEEIENYIINILFMIRDEKITESMIKKNEGIYNIVKGSFFNTTKEKHEEFETNPKELGIIIKAILKDLYDIARIYFTFVKGNEFGNKFLPRFFKPQEPESDAEKRSRKFKRKMTIWRRIKNSTSHIHNFLDGKQLYASKECCVLLCSLFLLTRKLEIKEHKKNELWSICLDYLESTYFRLKVMKPFVVDKVEKLPQIQKYNQEFRKIASETYRTTLDLIGTKLENDSQQGIIKAFIDLKDVTTKIMTHIYPLFFNLKVCHDQFHGMCYFLYSYEKYLVNKYKKDPEKYGKYQAPDRVFNFEATSYYEDRKVVRYINRFIGRIIPYDWSKIPGEKYSKDFGYSPGADVHQVQREKREEERYGKPYFTDNIANFILKTSEEGSDSIVFRKKYLAYKESTLMMLKDIAFQVTSTFRHKKKKKKKEKRKEKKKKHYYSDDEYDSDESVHSSNTENDESDSDRDTSIVIDLKRVKWSQQELKRRLQKLRSFEKKRFDIDTKRLDRFFNKLTEEDDNAIEDDDDDDDDDEDEVDRRDLEMQTNYGKSNIINIENQDYDKKIIPEIAKPHLGRVVTSFQPTDRISTPSSSISSSSSPSSPSSQTEASRSQSQNSSQENGKRKPEKISFFPTTFIKNEEEELEDGDEIMEEPEEIDEHLNNTNHNAMMNRMEIGSSQAFTTQGETQTLPMSQLPPIDLNEMDMPTAQVESQPQPQTPNQIPNTQTLLLGIPPIDLNEEIPVIKKEIIEKETKKEKYAKEIEEDFEEKRPELYRKEVKKEQTEYEDSDSDEIVLLDDDDDDDEDDIPVKKPKETIKQEIKEEPPLEEKEEIEEDKINRLREKRKARIKQEIAIKNELNETKSQRKSMDSAVKKRGEAPPIIVIDDSDSDDGDDDDSSDIEVLYDSKISKKRKREDDDDDYIEENVKKRRKTH